MMNLTEQVPGAFMETLTRNNRKIREDRALSIAEETRLKYRRKVEDLELRLSQLKRDRLNMLDLSPTDAHSLVVASDFDGDAFVEKHMEIGVKIREVEIQLEIANAAYSNLFGGSREITPGPGPMPPIPEEPAATE